MVTVKCSQSCGWEQSVEIPDDAPLAQYMCGNGHIGIERVEKDLSENNA